MKSQRAPSQTRGREAIESMTRPVQQVGPRGLVLKALLDLQRLGDLSSSRLVSRVTDHDHIVALIRELMDSTKHELLNMLAGGPHPPELFDPAKAFDIRTMSRVSMRMLYTPNTAVDPHNGSTLRDYAAAGGHVGVVMHVPYRVTVSDRACAVIPIDPRGSGAGALVVREPTIVASLVELFVNGHVEVPTGGQEKSPPCCWVSGVDGRLLSVLSGVAHAVGLAFGDDDGGVVQESVQDADGGGLFG